MNADPVRITQIVSNLVNNAAKYTKPGGRIAISAQTEGVEAVLQVTDNGIGIAPEMMTVIFGLFAQVPSAIEESAGGLGIGLTLVKSLVELHGGRVLASSEGLGKGSTFSMRLPLAQPAERSPSGPMADVAPRPEEAMDRREKGSH